MEVGKLSAPHSVLWGGREEYCGAFPFTNAVPLTLDPLHVCVMPHLMVRLTGEIEHGATVPTAMKLAAHVPLSFVGSLDSPPESRPSRC